MLTVNLVKAIWNSFSTTENSEISKLANIDLLFEHALASDKWRTKGGNVYMVSGLFERGALPRFSKSGWLST